MNSPANGLGGACLKRVCRRDRIPSLAASVSVSPDAVHLLTEYVLNLTMSATEDNDVTPLYEEYIRDARFGDVERQELMWVYMSLQLRDVGMPVSMRAAEPRSAMSIAG